MDTMVSLFGAARKWCKKSDLQCGLRKHLNPCHTIQQHHVKSGMGLSKMSLSWSDLVQYPFIQKCFLSVYIKKNMLQSIIQGGWIYCVINDMKTFTYQIHNCGKYLCCDHSSRNTSQWRLKMLLSMLRPVWFGVRFELLSIKGAMFFETTCYLLMWVWKQSKKWFNWCAETLI